MSKKPGRRTSSTAKNRGPWGSAWVDSHRRLLAALTLTLIVVVGFASLPSCESNKPYRVDTTTVRKEPDVRIRAKKAATTVQLAGGSTLTVRPAGGIGSAETLATPVTLRSGPQGVITTDGKGVTRTWGFGVDVEVVAPGAATGSVGDSVNLDGVRYPGFVTVRPAWKGRSYDTFDVVVTMPIETYIPGVLAKELYSNWPKQAFEAMAVAARSYALHERDRARRMNKDFDLESNTLDQAYAGTTTLTNALEAGRDTRGMVLTFEDPGGIFGTSVGSDLFSPEDRSGGVLRAYYSACCGGQPAPAAKIWPTGKGYEFNKAPPLQGSGRSYYCTDAKTFTWDAVRKTDDLSLRIRQWGTDNGHAVKKLGKLKKFDIAERTDWSRPTRYTLTDTSGQTASISAEDLRVACNYAAPGSPVITSGPTHVRSGNFTMEIGPTDTKIHGKGSGHAVGLCQFCAKGMAERGWDFQHMLREFYPGAEVKKVY